MVDVGTNYYHVVIEDGTRGNKWYHVGGNIVKNPPTSVLGKAKVYYSLSGAIKAKKSIENNVCDNLKISIMKFHPKLDV